MEFQIDKNSFSYEKYSEKFGNPGSSRKNEDAFLNRFLKEFDKKISQIQENVELKTRASTLRSSNTFGKRKTEKNPVEEVQGQKRRQNGWEGQLETFKNDQKGGWMRFGDQKDKSETNWKSNGNFGNVTMSFKGLEEKVSGSYGRSSMEPNGDQRTLPYSGAKREKYYQRSLSPPKESGLSQQKPKEIQNKLARISILGFYSTWDPVIEFKTKETLQGGSILNEKPTEIWTSEGNQPFRSNLSQKRDNPVEIPQPKGPSASTKKEVNAKINKGNDILTHDNGEMEPRTKYFGQEIQGIQRVLKEKPRYFYQALKEKIQVQIQRKTSPNLERRPIPIGARKSLVGVSRLSRVSLQPKSDSARRTLSASWVPKSQPSVFSDLDRVDSVGLDGSSKGLRSSFGKDFGVPSDLKPTEPIEEEKDKGENGEKEESVKGETRKMEELFQRKQQKQITIDIPESEHNSEEENEKEKEETKQKLEESNQTTKKQAEHLERSERNGEMEEEIKRKSLSKMNMSELGAEKAKDRKNQEEMGKETEGLSISKDQKKGKDDLALEKAEEKEEGNDDETKEKRLKSQSGIKRKGLAEENDVKEDKTKGDSAENVSINGKIKGNDRKENFSVKMSDPDDRENKSTYVRFATMTPGGLERQGKNELGQLAMGKRASLQYFEEEQRGQLGSPWEKNKEERSELGMDIEHDVSEIHATPQSSFTLASSFNFLGLGVEAKDKNIIVGVAKSKNSNVAIPGNAPLAETNEKKSDRDLKNQIVSEVSGSNRNGFEKGKESTQEEKVQRRPKTKETLVSVEFEEKANEKIERTLKAALGNGGESQRALVLFQSYSEGIASIEKIINGNSGDSIKKRKIRPFLEKIKEAASEMAEILNGSPFKEKRETERMKEQVSKCLKALREDLRISEGVECLKMSL